MKALKIASAPSILGTLAVVSCVYLVTFAFLPKQGFWINDNGIKFLQVEALLAGGAADGSLHWPGERVDPGFRWNPVPYPHFVIWRGKLYSAHSLVFAAVSSAMFRFLGFAGLYVLPLAAAVVMLGGMAAVARMVSPYPSAPHWAVVSAGLLTPVWFYSCEFWEHTPALALTVWGIYFLLRNDQGGRPVHLFLGGLLAALAVAFRDEHYLFCLVLLVVTFFRARVKKTRAAFSLGLGLGAGAIPLWVVQWSAVGRPLGHHVASGVLLPAGVGGHFLSRGRIFYNLFLAAGPVFWLSLVAAAPFVAALLVYPRLTRQGFSRAVPLLGTLGLACGVVALRGYMSGGQPLAWMMSSNSVFTGSPFLMLGFLRPGDEVEKSTAARVFLRSVVLLYAALFWLALPEDRSAGLGWGKRILLVLYPLLALLAALNVADWLKERKKLLSWGFVAVTAVVLVSFASQAYAVVLLGQRKEFSARANQMAREYAEPVIVSDVWWAPMEIYSVFYEKMVFSVQDPNGFRDLAGLLCRRGTSKAIFVTRQPAAAAQPGVRVLEDRAFHSLDLYFAPLDLCRLGRR